MATFKTFFGFTSGAAGPAAYRLYASPGAFTVTGNPANLISTVHTGFDPAKTATAIALSNNNLTATNIANQERSTFTKQAAATKVYVEIKIDYMDLYWTIGIGIGTATADFNSFLGAYNDSIGLYDGDIWIGTGTGPAIGVFFTTGDVLAVAIDKGAETISFRNVTAGLPWSTPYAYAAVMDDGPIYLGHTSNHTNDKITANFDGAFVGTAPSGYTRWNGTAITATTAYTLTAQTGVFALAGKPAGLRAARRMPATTGAFALTGNAANLFKSTARILTAQTGAVALAGQAAVLRVGRVLTAAKGTFTLSGQAAALRAARQMPATTGAFTLTGINAGLRAARQLAAAKGAIVLSGKDATLFKGGARILPAATGAVVLTGNAAGLRIARKMAAAKGTFTLSGQAAALLRPRILVAAPRAIVLSGKDAGLRSARRMAAAKGTITLSGNAAALLRPRFLAAEPGAIVLTGIPADFILTTVPQHYVMYANRGAIRFTFTEAILTSTAPYYPVSMASLMNRTVHLGTLSRRSVRQRKF